MAGIGFRLQKLMMKGSFGNLITAYLYSAVIATGPLLIVTVALIVMNVLTQVRLTPDEKTLFMGLLVYIYAFSMVGVGPFIYSVTRYLADRYFLKEMAAFTPTYFTVLKVLFSLQAIVGAAFLIPAQFPLAVKLTAFCLLLIVSGTWMAMVFLSAARSYLWIVAAFAVGTGIGVATAMALGKRYGFNGFLNGFALGQALTFLILTWRIIAEFGYRGSHDFGFLDYFRRHPYLVFVGLFYHLGLWVDKFIFWLSPQGEWVSGSFLLCPNYDVPSFMAYLTVIPSMAFFLVQMETTFVRCYHAYYESVRKRESLGVIRYRRQVMSDNLTDQYQRFILFQGTISGLVIVFLYEIADALYLQPAQMGIFRIAILGAVMQMGFIMTLTILFYFDFQKNAFWLAVFYFLSNTILTSATLVIGFPAYGFGYAASCFLSFLVGIMVLHIKLKNLNYWTFMTQPVLVPNFKFESE